MSGAAGSNACPAGSVRIEAEAACRAAAAAAGKSAASTIVLTYAFYPRGCYYDNNNNAYFNAHAVGAGHWAYRLLCAAVTTGALSPRHRFGRARARMRDCCDGMGGRGMHVGRIGYEFARVWGGTCKE